MTNPQTAPSAHLDLVWQTPESTVVAAYAPVERAASGYESEAALEAQFVATLVGQGYERLPITCEADLIPNLRAQLERLNGLAFTDGEWQRFFTTQIASSTEGIVAKARKLHDDDTQLLLTRDDGTSANVRLLDKRNIHNNHLQVINQYVADEGLHDNRYDVTILVNGLPLVHVELKRRGVALKEAFNQIERYQRESFWSGQGLFEYVQVFVISNGTATKYYANTTRLRRTGTYAGRPAGDSFEFTMWWTDAANHRIADLADVAQTFFSRHTLLALLTRYCVFNTAEDLMVMRPYQIVATEAILNRILLATNRKQMGTPAAGGYIWHTTGSGKTLTSFKTAQLATGLGQLDKVLFVVDRQDLDNKTMADFERYQKGAVTGSTSTQALKRALENPAARIVVTTIQKLTRFIDTNPNHPVYTQHVAIVFDECHRSQFGEMHRAITGAFKRYHLFGFTGTPIFTVNAASGGDPRLKTTQQAFGDCLHTYTIADAIRDETVLPFKVDYVRTARARDGLPDAKVEGIDSQAALEAPERIANVVSYIRAHFAQKTMRASGKTYLAKGERVAGFNSILATSGIDAAKRYYAEFARQQADVPPGERLRIGLVYSFAPNEESPDGFLPEEDLDASRLDASSRDFLEAAIADYNRMFASTYSVERFENYFRNVSARLKDRDLDLLIVVDMFLTGFDAPTLNTLWVDKNLRMHGLVQAFSRTNRILNTVKSFGQIVCFRNLEEATRAAIGLFGDAEASGVVLLRPYQEYYDDYAAKVADVLARFPLGRTITDEKGFVVAWSAILRLLNLLTTFDQFTPDVRVLSDRERQDYDGEYMRLREKYARRDADKESILDDVVFEVELVKRVEIGLPQILEMVRAYHDGNCQDQEILANVERATAASPSLRSKRDLIEAFIASLAPGADVDDAWVAFIASRKRAELDALIATLHLSPSPTRRLMEAAFRDGGVPTSGMAVAAILPPISHFAPDNAYARTTERVLDALAAYYDRFADL